MNLPAFLRAHWDKLAIIAVIIVALSILIPYYVIPDYTSQAKYFQKYPVNVFLEVEEPLRTDTLTLLALLAFESLNETFEYRINLASISTFPDDNIWNYSDEILNDTLWMGSVGGSRSLRWSVKDGSMRMNMKAFTGQGPERDYFGSSGRALGISNYGDKWERRVVWACSLIKGW